MRVSAALVLVAGAAFAEDTGAVVAAHTACAADRPRAVCAEIVTGHCLDTARSLRALTVCRAAMARALEAEAVRLTAALIARNARSQAAEAEATAARIATEVCQDLAGRMASPGGANHDIRCRLLQAHVAAYGLARQLAGLGRRT